jgi:hypothetical protein
MDITISSVSKAAGIKEVKGEILWLRLYRFFIRFLLSETIDM